MKTLFILLLGISVIAFAQNGYAESEYVVLPSANARALMDQCSRATPPEFSGTWEPEPEAILALEEGLRAIETLEPKLCCLPGVRIQDVSVYRRQYVGVVIGGRKLIYINAFHRDVVADEWKTRPIVACDGGVTFWGALYDPGTNEFFDLAINGVA